MTTKGLANRAGVWLPVLTIGAAAAGHQALFAEEFEETFPASTGFVTGTIAHVQRQEEAVLLQRHDVVENDAPGAGIGQEPDGTYRRSYALVGGETQIRKELILDDPRADGALLAFYGQEPGGDGFGRTPLMITVNGHTLEHASFWAEAPEPHRRSRLSWMYARIPTNLLKSGSNDIRFHNPSAEHPWRIHVSESRYFELGADGPAAIPPERSYKSTDGGATWTREDLGVEIHMTGEYTVRLCLDRYRTQGTITWPVVDLSAGEDPIRHRTAVQSIEIEPIADMPPGTNVVLELRAGDTYQVRPNRWSVWIPAERANRRIPQGRYVQWRARLTTENPLESPRLHGVRLNVRRRVFPAPEPGRITVVSENNPRILRTSYPYEYEPFDHPRLVELRTRYRLDDVIADARTEFDAIMRIKEWTARQYAREALIGYPAISGRQQPYPPWDANVMLEQRGFSCISMSILFMQACLSVGIQSRHVQINTPIGGGHEINEVWSNDYGKWVAVDPGYNYIVRQRDGAVPLSVAEIQEILRRHADRDLYVELIPGAPGVPLKMSMPEPHPVQILFEPAPMNDMQFLGREGVSPADYTASHLSRYFFFGIVPRNNMLSRPTPIPLNQGTSHWPWNGYVWWTDPETPKRPEYTQYAIRPQDMYWTLNQTAFTLQHGPREGMLLVQLDTVTPDFDSFLARFDDGPWRSVDHEFDWPLAPGVNSLELRTQNRAGRRGPISSVRVAHLAEARAPLFQHAPEH